MLLLVALFALNLFGYPYALPLFKVDKMEISLVGRESSEAHGHTDGHSHKHSLGQIDSPNVISSQSVHEFEIVVPELDGPHTQSGTKFSVDWTIEVRLYIPWAKDPTIRVPVTILPARREDPNSSL